MFDKLNEIVYVTDNDTHEVVYANQMALKTVGADSLESIIGQKCYKVIQGIDAPCKICPVPKLKVGDYTEWKYFIPFLRKPFLIRDTLVEHEGKVYHLQMASDLTEEEEQRKITLTHINTESIFCEGMRKAMEKSEPDEAINALIKYIGSSLTSERMYIFEKEPDGTYSNTYEWCARGVTSEIDSLQNMPQSAFKQWLLRFKFGQTVVIDDLEETKNDDPEMYEILKPQNIHSLVVNPLMCNGEVIGFYGMDNPPGGLLEKISSLFMMLGYFICSLLEQRNITRELHEASVGVH
jgi:hypothetical protein